MNGNAVLDISCDESAVTQTWPVNFKMLQLLLDLHYLIPRVLFWTLLFVAALVDTIRHRHVKRRGHQLQRGVLFVIGAIILQDFLLLAYAAQKGENDAAAPSVYLAYIFFTNFSDSSFIVRLLPRHAQNNFCTFTRCFDKASFVYAGSSPFDCCWFLVSLSIFTKSASHQILFCTRLRCAC